MNNIGNQLVEQSSLENAEVEYPFNYPSKWSDLSSNQLPNILKLRFNLFQQHETNKYFCYLLESVCFAWWHLSLASRMRLGHTG